MKKGYKSFNENLQCRGFQFEVGNTYELPLPVTICENGFHYCEKLENVYGYYERSSSTRICEVEDLGSTVTEGDKSCTNKIRIVREITGKELIDAILKGNNSGRYNSGDRNSGWYNSGDHNSGYRNSGYRNSGRYNSGDRNSGWYNSGDHNSGSYNSGYYNSGYRNSGNYNSGSYNSGYYNSGWYNSGFFNTNTPSVRLFNKDTNISWDDPRIERLQSLPVLPILRWVETSDMSEEEKSAFPSHKTTGGFLRNTGKSDWSKLTDDDKEFIKSLPNFDAAIFKEITGVEL